ncbi:MAG: serine/threonine-protein phosphatase [Deltaproteobacteria bacterium]|nr:serine/threonine-protein phosphatase [Deltaproteobacteria bacterium]MDQ3298104.1 protein phosphatase 2C domain-containing protein [Myxococcota bacterium]
MSTDGKPVPAELELVIAGASDVGQVREHNEDSFLIGDLDRHETIELPSVEWVGRGQRGALLVVCDGMGGVEGGEIASELAAKVMWREMKNTPASPDPEVFARLLRRAVRVANHDVHAMARREPGLRGMGTTLSAAGVVADRLIVATVGDSRVYVLRSQMIIQVTRDQSLHSALIAAGHNEDEAASAGGAILQALGVGPDVDPSLSIIELRRGDRVLLCSDGLHGLVGDPALALLMSQPHTVTEAVRLLVAAARAAGGTDNITAIVCQVDGERLVPPADDDDLPRFREFDPQQEGDPALTSTSYVARRLAAKIGIPTASIPPTIPATGQHAVMHSRIGIRVAHGTALPIDEVDGPARRRLRRPMSMAWYVVIGMVACALAWWLGGR